MTLLRKQSQFRAEADVTTWIYRITTNLCLNRIRTRKRRDVRNESDEVASWHTIAPSDPYARCEAKSLFLGAMSDLDTLDQRIVVYRFLDGMSQEEIAEVTGKSRRTVGKRVRRVEERFATIAQETNHA